MSKPIVHVYRFASSSGGGTYETLLYSDGSTSCDCKGWTRRCVNGQRSCKHTRAVEGGAAGLQWTPPLEDHPVGKARPDVVTKDGAIDHKTTKEEAIPSGGRKFL